MNISIFGLGYVGCVSAGCLAKLGHKVIGVDVNSNKVNLINLGRATIIEKDIDKIIREQHKLGNLRATKDVREAVKNTDISIICVGTPHSKSGHLNFEYIYKVAEEIGQALKEKETFHVIAIRSTVTSGTNNKVSEIIEGISGKIKNVDFAMVSNPEFLREGIAVHDYMNPAFTLLGSESEKALKIMSEIYNKIEAPIIKTDIEVAEVMKYINNTFHALKITFANEVGNLCKGLNIDSHKVMDILCKDNKLNISPYYLKPGFAYGGSCLPKDLDALNALSRDMALHLPVISSIAASNEIQKELVLNRIIDKGKKKIGILGLSFKAETDDLRESPIVDVVERLIGKGYNVKIYDKNIYVSNLTGTNKDFVEKKIPHLKNLITNDIKEVIDFGDVVVITNNEREIREFFIDKKALEEKIVIDLVRIEGIWENVGEYDGLCW